MSDGGEIALLQNVHERLRTLDGAKDFYCEVIADFAAGLISERSARALVYALTGYLQYLRLDADTRIEERIEELERTLQGVRL